MKCKEVASLVRSIRYLPQDDYYALVARLILQGTKPVCVHKHVPLKGCVCPYVPHISCTYLDMSDGLIVHTFMSLLLGEVVLVAPPHYLVLGRVVP